MREQKILFCSLYNAKVTFFIKVFPSYCINVQKILHKIAQSITTHCAWPDVQVQ